MSIGDAIAKILYDRWHGKKLEGREQLDRVADYVAAAADVIDRIGVQTPPDILGSCEELGALLKGLYEEPTFIETLSDDERDALIDLLRRGDTGPGFLLVRYHHRSGLYLRGEDLEHVWHIWPKYFARSRMEALSELAHIAGRLRGICQAFTSGLSLKSGHHVAQLRILGA